jgi:hypothetical protein
MEQTQALAARHRMNPTENFDLLSMFAFQRTTIGKMTKTRSVRVEKAATNKLVSGQCPKPQCTVSVFT